MTRLGVSTSTLTRRTDLEALLAYDPEVVEFYNYPSALLPRLERFCGRHGIQPALHTPVPYDLPSPLRRFAPTGPDAQEAAEALRLTELTVRCAADLGALHVVVHFPSPYPPYPTAGFHEACAAFLDAVAESARHHRVPVLIENLSAHPLLRTPEHYERILAHRPELGLCLDLGHAHLLGADVGTPLGFATAMGTRVRSMHVYNTTPARLTRHGHEPASATQSQSDGYLDLTTSLPKLLRLTRPAVLVMEHGPSGIGAGRASRTAAWLRDLIRRHAADHAGDSA